MPELTILAAFLAGIVSFLSPCVLPLIPGFLAYLAGSGASKTKLFITSIFFVLGFSTIFAILGVLLNTILLQVLQTIQTWLSRIAGFLIIIFGLYLVGLLKIKFFDQTHKLTIKRKFSTTYLTAFIFGAAFAVGWTPCVGPILGAVLALAVANPSSSFILLLTYALGLGIPFLLLGLFSDKLITLLKQSKPILKYFNIIVGIILILLGILIFTETLNLVANVSLLYPSP